MMLILMTLVPVMMLMSDSVPAVTLTSVSAPGPVPAVTAALVSMYMLISGANRPMEFGRLLERQLSKTFKTVTLSARQGHSRYFKLYYLPESQSLVLMIAQTLTLMIATMMITT